MAVAAEQEKTQFDDLLFELNQPEVFVVPEMAGDQAVVEKTARFIGAVLANHTVEIQASEVEKPIESLFDAIRRAAEGDKQAEKVIELNARTDVIERTIKVGHVMDPVPLFINEQGKVVQHGQSYDSIQANSLRHAAENPIMRARTEAEARNAFRTERLNREGFFDDGYSMVVFSRAEDLPGFFTATMSVAIQVTRKQGNGLAVETAFVAGVAEPGAEQHDDLTIVSLAATFGVDLSGKTPAEIIDTPLLIKDMTAIDLVKRYDDCAGGTFFGENKPRQDYEQYHQTCHQREQGFAPKVAAIKAELIAEAHLIHSPVQATQHLHKISEKHMVEHAITDHSIDARVFGPGAMHVVQARMYEEAGNHEAARQETARAKETAVTSSCPDGSSATRAEGQTTAVDDKELPKAGEDKYGSLTFKCPKGHTNYRPYGRLIPNCQRCGVSVRC